MRISIHVLALAAVALAVTTPAAAAAKPEAVLRQLHVATTEDVASDEPYLQVDGDTVWGPRSVDEGDNRTIGVVVQRGDKVRLYEQDGDVPFDDDDFLGEAEVADRGGTLRFERDGARYTLSYGPRPSARDYILRRGPLLSGAIARLDARLRRSGVQALLRRANRKLAGSGCAKRAAVPPGADVLCLQSGDDRTREWYPQGVTTTSDANADEHWGRKRALVVTWYDKGKAPEKGVRLSFVDPDRRRYRHVLLVYPTRTRTGKPTYRAIDSHAGGIAWYGNYLYVAETRRGVRVFDVRDIFDLGLSENGTTRNRKRIGLHGKTYYGAGNRYVLPQLTYYANAAQAPARSCRGVGAPLHSWVSLDRSRRPDVLMTGEYCKDALGRVGLWRVRDLDPRSSLGAAAHSVNYLPDEFVQGGTASHGTYWFTRRVPIPAGRRNRGRLVIGEWTPGGVQRNHTDVEISKGAEDLSCWRSTSRLWTLAEHPGDRALYGVPDRRCR